MRGIIKTLEFRLKLFIELFGASRAAVSSFGLTLYEHLHTTKVEDVFLAPSYTNNFRELFNEIIGTDLYDGLVLKKANARLETGFNETNNSTWQVKAQKETKNYSL